MLMWHKSAALVSHSVWNTVWELSSKRNCAYKKEVEKALAIFVPMIVHCLFGFGGLRKNELGIAVKLFLKAKVLPSVRSESPLGQ